MIRNYFKTAWRNLLNNKGFAIINSIGLSIGVAACILISIYIIHESSYDKKVPNAANIYRLINRDIINGRIDDGVHFSANTASTALEDFIEVENSGRLMDNALFWGAGSNEIRINEKPAQYHEKGFTYADQSIIDIMGIPMIYGNASSALSKPQTIVISELISKKYFGDKNPIGNNIYLNGKNDLPYKINGVMKNFQSNSHIHYDFLITLKGVEFGEGEQTRWLQNNYFTYLVLRPNTDIVAFEKKISNTFIEKYLKPAMTTSGYVIPVNYAEVFSIKTQPLTAINLHSTTINFETSFRNDIKIIWIFGIIALFILIIASINFVNLSTAKSANRAKEVGLRKVFGSTRVQLIGQFLMESILITFISFGIGMLLSLVMMPLFREMTGKELEIPWSHPVFIPILLATALLVGFLAGLYPSFYLSSFKPVDTLKGKLNIHTKSGGLRSGLVVFQFTISIILIVGTLIVNKQMNFILNSKVGFEKNQVIQIYGTNMLNDKIDTFKEELKKIPGVNNVSISDFLPIEGTKRNGNSFVNEGRDNLDETVGGQAWVIDEDYIETLGMQLLSGRNFSKKKSSDKQTTIINQTMANKLHLKNPIGKKISRYGNLFEIIGVVEDFNFNTMKESVQPLCFFYGISPSIISIKTNTSNLSALLIAVKKTWGEFVPNMAFRYEFMETSFAKMYDNTKRIRSLFTTFAILAIVVACLGLFALSAYLVEQRNKEISIRKVLGVSMTTIFQLLTSNFLTLVFLSFVIATPIAYYLMKIWLQDYKYSIPISWSVFTIAGIISIAISIATVSYHAIRSTLINPIDNLRRDV